MNWFKRHFSRNEVWYGTFFTGITVAVLVSILWGGDFVAAFASGGLSFLALRVDEIRRGK